MGYQPKSTAKHTDFLPPARETVPARKQRRNRPVQAKDLVPAPELGPGVFVGPAAIVRDAGYTPGRFAERVDVRWLSAILLVLFGVGLGLLLSRWS